MTSEYIGISEILNLVACVPFILMYSFFGEGSTFALAL